MQLCYNTTKAYFSYKSAAAIQKSYDHSENSCFYSKKIKAGVFESPATTKERRFNLSEEAIDLLNVCLDAKLKVKNDSTEGAGNMCKGIEEALEIMRAEGIAEGKLTTLFQLVQDGLLELSIGAERAGMSVEEFKKALSQP